MSNNFNGTLRVSSWGATKFIETSNAAVAPTRLSQVVSFPQRVLSIGWVSSYLLISAADSTVDFSVTMEVRNCDVYGVPTDLLGSDTLLSSELSSPGWYKFEMDIDEMDNPADGLCIIFFQTGGDENNYASWGYNVGDYSGAAISIDSGTSWTATGGIHRVMRVAANFDAYGNIIPDNVIVTPSGTGSFGGSFTGGTYNNTTLITDPSPYYGYQQEGTQKIVLESKDLHVSIVADSSGSMGWRDRFGVRKSVAEELVSRFNADYPGIVTFDFVNFGGRPLDIVPVSQTKKVMGVFVSIDDLSVISGHDSDGNPLVASDIRDHLGSGIVSYGFKNLSDGTEYVNYGFNLGWSETTFSDAGVKWADMWSVGNPTRSSGEVGPDGASSMTISVSDPDKDSVRYVFGNDVNTPREIPVMDVTAGDTVLDVANDPTVFQNGSTVSVVDRNGISSSRRVIDSSTTSITVDPLIHQAHLGIDGVVVESSPSDAFSKGWEQTDGIEFFFLDAAQQGDVTFYLQTANGAHVEWDFTPLADWEFVNLYFLDQTAEFDIETVDANGDPLPNGTTVEFYVDKNPEDDFGIDTENEQETIALVQDAVQDSTFLYVSAANIGKFSRGDSIDIIDDNRNPQGLASGGTKEYHTTTVTAIVEETARLTIADSMPSDFLMTEHSSILLPATDESDFKSNLKTELPIDAGLVEVTPIYVGEKVPEALRDQLDPPQVEPTDGYDDSNDDPDRVIVGSMELTTMNGYAAIRLSPVTEDRFMTSDTKDAFAKSMFDLTERELVRQQALDDMEKGEMKDDADDAVFDEDETAEVISPDPVYYDGEPDFVMDHKVVSINGLTSTDMSSFTEDLTPVTLGSANAREYIAKKYSINPVMTIYDTSGERFAIVLMDAFDVYFASPIFIRSSVDSVVTFYDCSPPEPEEEPYDIDVPGAYATDAGEITVSYEITDKDFPANGTLSVSIYDARRDILSANVQDEDLDDPNGCGDTEALLGVNNVASSNAADDAYAASIENSLLADDLLGDSPSQFTLEVVAGKASFTLPQQDRVALLEIHAEFEYESGNRKIVNKQNVYYKSPVVLRMTGMGNAVADGETKVNVGATVWWKEEGPVDDGTIVNFESGGSSMTPSMSETISGSADGVLLGPHEPIPAPTTVAEIAAGGNGEDESVSAEVSYRGFSVKKSGSVIWAGTLPAANFYFYAKAENTNPDSEFSGGDSLWSDGYDYVTVNGDLPASSFRAFPFIEQVYQDLVGDNMGVVYSGSGLTVETRLPRWSMLPPTEGPYEDDTDVPYGWVTNRVYSNVFIGRPPYREAGDDPNPCDSPECKFVTLFTRSRKNNVIGTGIDSETPTFPATTPGGSPATIPKPKVRPVEPLGITLSIEPVDRAEYQSATWRETPLGESPKGPGFDEYSHPIVRDGESRYWVVAEVTWKDDYIVNSASNALPDVSFDIGTYETSESGDVTLIPFYDPNDAPLDAPTATVGHLRTTCDSDHYHEVVLDANGIGTTTVTVSYGETIVADHVHAVSLHTSPVVAEYEIHNHSLRSAAVVGMGPVRNRTLPIAVRGTVTYDNGKMLSSGSRVDRTLENYAFSSPAGDEANPTLGYKLEIITVDKQYTEGKVVDAFPTRLSGDGAGYTVIYRATVILPDGSEGPVEDGTRIFTSFKFYEFDDDDTGNEQDSDVIVISREDEVKNYAVLKVNGFFSEFPDEAKADKEVMITSSVRWFPSVDASRYIRKPETDPLSIQNAIDSFTELGSSQLNDAVSLAARRIIKFSDYIGDSKKIIIILSDMNESQSEYSYDQALADVSAADSLDNVEVFPVKVANVDTYSDLVAQKYAVDSGGQVISVNDVDDITQTAIDSVESIIQSPNFDVTSGTYTNVVDLGDTRLFSSLKFNTATPTGTGTTFKVRFSDDGVTYGEWIILGAGSEFDIDSSSAFGRFMQYEVTFSGNPDTFESPEFTGMEYDYFEPSGYTMFFQPIQIREGADGYVGEIIFTHQGTVPDTSRVRYGISHSRSSDLVDYGWNSQPLMKDGFGGIVLSRVNELLQRGDSVNYTAPYGGWNRFYDVEVYRITSGYPMGIMVDPTSYSADSTLGKIVFGQSQPSSDKFTMTLGLNSEFSIVVDMINYGGDTISLDYIGAMYRTIDRTDIYSSSRDSIESVVDTDLGTMETSGTLTVTGVSYVSEMGKDSDLMKDVLLIDDIYYVLVHDELEDNAYVATLASNFTFIERFELGSLGTPVSFDIMDNIWHFSYIDGAAIKVLRTDASFSTISTSDFGYTDEHPAVMRSYVDRWYAPNESLVNVFGRSFNSVSDVALDYEISPLISVHMGAFSAISLKKDIIFEFSLDGVASRAYSLNTRASNVVNIRRTDGSILMVEPSRIVSGELS